MVRMNELIDPSKITDISQIPLAKIPSYEFLASFSHFTPKFNEKVGACKFTKYNNDDYFEFENGENRITKVSKFRSKK